MFGGEAAELQDVLRQALGSARDLGHQRAGSEHLLLALARQEGRPAQFLARHGATAAAVRDAVVTAAPAGAGAAADRELLAALGPGLDGLAGTVLARSAGGPRSGVPARREPGPAALRADAPAAGPGRAGDLGRVAAAGAGPPSSAGTGPSIWPWRWSRSTRARPGYCAGPVPTGPRWRPTWRPPSRRPRATRCCGPSAGSDSGPGLGTWSGATSA